MFNWSFLTSILIATSVLIPSTLAFDASLNSNVAVYWGQASAGSQQRLSYYCESSDVDIVILSFMNAFPTISLDFSSACSDTFLDGLLKCDQIASDIQTCQANGKIVLLSLGGASGAYGFTSDSQATTFASTLYNKFLGGSDPERPFGNAILDGFDFDMESGVQTGLAALGTALRQQYKKDSKTYYLSAAPQCPYPDASVGEVLANVDVDFAFIQFYNNYCGLGSNFNWDTWASFAANTSPNKNIKLYLGLAGSTSAAGSGYVSTDTVKQYVDSLDATNLGGISIWDASQAWANTDSSGATFAHRAKEILEELSGTSTSGTSTSSTATTASTVTISSSTSPATTSTSATAIASAIASAGASAGASADASTSNSYTLTSTSTITRTTTLESSTPATSDSTTLTSTSTVVKTTTASSSEESSSSVSPSTSNVPTSSIVADSTSSALVETSESSTESSASEASTSSSTFSSTFSSTSSSTWSSSNVPTTLATVTKNTNDEDDSVVYVTLTTHVKGYVTSTVIEQGTMKTITRYTGTNAVYVTAQGNKKTVYQTVTQT